MQTQCATKYTAKQKLTWNCGSQNH